MLASAIGSGLASVVKIKEAIFFIRDECTQAQQQQEEL